MLAFFVLEGSGCNEQGMDGVGIPEEVKEMLNS